jgi:hypothetical protein
MTHPLATLRESLIDDQSVAEKLKLADQYLLTMTKLGTKFVLPREHIELLPVLEYYGGGDVAGWCKYVRSIRDSLPQGNRMADVQEVFRTIEIRRVQGDRRIRLNLAVNKAVELGVIEDTAEAKRQYANKCTQEWSKRRADMLSNIRRTMSNKRVNEDERADVLEEFWKAIEAGIKEGDIPR